jgi:streptogramin lyase
MLVLILMVSVDCSSKGSSTTAASRARNSTPSSGHLYRTSSSPASSHPAGGSLLRIDPATNKVAAKFDVGRAPSGIAIGEGSVWVTDSGDHTVRRLDPATGEVEAAISVPQQPTSIAIGGGVPGVWVTGVDQVWRIDPRANKASLSKDVAEPIGAVSTGIGSVWVSVLWSGIDAIDPTTRHLKRNVVGPIGQGLDGDHVRPAPPSVTTGFGSVWIARSPPPQGGSPVWRFDPKRHSWLTIRLPFDPIALAVGDGSVWASSRTGQVAMIDPKTNAKKVIISGNGYGVTQIAAGLGAVWVLNPLLETLTRIDHGRNVVVATIEVGPGATAVAVGEGFVWVTRGL